MCLNKMCLNENPFRFTTKIHNKLYNQWGDVFLQIGRLLRITKITKYVFCVRLQTDAIRLVSSKLVLLEGSAVRDGLFECF